jgi:flagellar hook-basal body complex protein FliE
MPVDPSFAINGLKPEISGPEWQIDGAGPGAATGAPAAGGQGFGGMLTNQISNLEQVQGQAAEASRALAQGTATDVSSVVMDIERARLSMQLASQIRTKAVEAMQDVFHTQV